MEDKDVNMGICGRIHRLRVEYAGARGKAAFARELGISPSTYDYYEKKRVPPADILVRIAELTDVDVRWLLTGKEPTAAPAPSHHPVIVRAAELLASHPHYGPAMQAFVDLLAETAETFSAKDRPPLVAGKVTAVEAAQAGRLLKSGARPAAASLVAAMVSNGDVQESHEAHPVSEDERQGWIPILGRSAAGVPHFWSEAGGANGATMLSDLVSMMKPRVARRVHRAEAVGDLAPETGEHVQLVLLDSPEPPGTAEFVIAEHIARKYDMLFAVRIDGESMDPEINHGDVVVLSPSCPAEAGKPAVVQLADQIGVTCKLVRFDADRVHLIPINESFAPTSYPRETLVWALKVIARIRPI